MKPPRSPLGFVHVHAMRCDTHGDVTPQDINADSEKPWPLWCTEELVREALIHPECQKRLTIHGSQTVKAIRPDACNICKEATA